jgi:hypothetical protein
MYNKNLSFFYQTQAKYNIQMQALVKFTSFLLMLLMTISLYGQKGIPRLPMETGKLTYTEVVTLDSIDKAELFSRAEEWFARTFNSAQDVIQMKDKEAGKIIGKAVMPVTLKGLNTGGKGGFINYTVAVYFKDNRYKYEINDFYHTGESLRGGYSIPDWGACELMLNSNVKWYGFKMQKHFNSFFWQIDFQIKSLINSLKTAMEQSIETSDDDW